MLRPVKAYACYCLRLLLPAPAPGPRSGTTVRDHGRYCLLQAAPATAYHCLLPATACAWYCPRLLLPATACALCLLDHVAHSQQPAEYGFKVPMVHKALFRFPGLSCILSRPALSFVINPRSTILKFLRSKRLSLDFPAFHVLRNFTCEPRHKNGSLLVF